MYTFHRLVFTLIALVGLSAAATAQFNPAFLKFGFQLSPSISWMTTDDNRIDGNGTALGLKLGTLVEYQFAPNYAITSGIGFHFNTGGTLQSAYGGRFFTNSLSPADGAFAGEVGPNVSLDYSIQYVEIPLSLRLRTREFGYLTYFADAPMFSLKFRSNVRGNISGGSTGQELDDIVIKKEVSPIGLAWGFGGGMEYSVSEATRLFAGLQFQRVFTDVTKDKDYTYLTRTSASDPKAGINSITLRLGVIF